ncbi:hypothetical protein [Streptomyces ziwulingensis]|uniref:DUF2637 domain-containing protein n=1 Tax=Streptomyces ziwulingensis TaxID=1045501 RepID=A0ABP9CYD9_9ACTN
MYEEFAYSPENPAYYPPGGYGWDGAGRGRHRAPVEAEPPPLVPDLPWDPAEELAFMLQDAVQWQGTGAPAPPAADVPAEAPVPGGPSDDLPEEAAGAPPTRDAAPGHRKTRAPREPRTPREPRERRLPRGLDAVSYLTAALTTVIAFAVSLLSGIVTYDPLRLVALTRLPSDVVAYWPLLVYGPWLVASLSVLRAALHQRRAVHSWSVVLVFSLIAVFLCVAQVSGSVIDIAAAALPGLAGLACFQQLVRQITLTRPPRRATPRHRVRPEPARPAGAEEESEPAAAEETPAAGAPRREGAEPRRPGPARTVPEPAPVTYVISENRPLRNPGRHQHGPVPQPRRA